MRGAPIEFWFDFSSGYAYFAAHVIDEVAERHDRSVLWRPYMLGVAFKHTGARGLSSTPMKGDYARRDWARLARMAGLEFQLPPNHPITALPASRAYYWVSTKAPFQGASGCMSYSPIAASRIFVRLSGVANVVALPW